MGDELAIGFPAVLAAKNAWSEQADQLRGAAASIDEIDATSVGPRAGGALALFCDHWGDRLRAMQTEAQGNADKLGDVFTVGLLVDQAQAEGISGLLPHES